MTETESPQSLYAKNLRQPFGYPLRSPEPDPGLPSSYKEQGLHIGDVGYVDRLGMFHVLFNICHPPDHDLHQDMEFADIEVGLVTFKPSKAPLISNAIPSGRVICYGMQGPQGENLNYTGSPCTFELKSCAPSGAILILPSGAVCRYADESLEEEFQKLAEKYAPEWSRATKRKSLYLITGCYKASSWYLASFHDVRQAGQMLLERKNAGGFTWDTRCDFRQSPIDNSSENQTVLITGFKIEVRDWDNRVLIEGLPPRSKTIWCKLSSLANYALGILLFLLRMVSRVMLGFQYQGTTKDEGPTLHVNPVPALSQASPSSWRCTDYGRAIPQPFHPSDIINRYLLHKNHGVRVAITHDKTWLNMIEKVSPPVLRIFVIDHGTLKDKLSFADMMEEELFWTFLEDNF